MTCRPFTMEDSIPLLLPLNISIAFPIPPSKPNKLKIWIFNIKWNWKNRKWQNCRAKRRAYEKALKEI